MTIVSSEMLQPIAHMHRCLLQQQLKSMEKDQGIQIPLINFYKDLVLCIHITLQLIPTSFPSK